MKPIAFKNNSKTVKQLLLLVIVILFSLACNHNSKKTENTQSDDESNALIESAKKFIAADDYNSALNIYNQAIKEDSTNAKLYKLRVSCYKDIYRSDTTNKSILQNALNDLSRVIMLEPSTEHYIDRGDFYSNYLYNTSQALKEYNLAVNVNNADTLSALSERAYFYFSIMKDSAKAFADYRKLIEYYPTHASVFIDYADALRACKRYEEALENLLRAKENDDSFYDFDKIGYCYLKLQDYLSALYYYEKEADVNCISHCVYRGYCKFKLGQIEAGKREMNLSMSRSSKEPPFRKRKPSFFFEVFPDAPNNEEEKNGIYRYQDTDDWPYFYF